MAFWLYNALVLAASPLWGGWLVWRLVGQRKDRRGFRQRWRGLDPAGLPAAPDRTPRIWVHAVSVGEVMAVAPVVRALRRRWPRALIVGSTVTDLGQEAMTAKAPELDAVFYLPFDLPWSVRRTIRTLRPTLFLFAEAELWPNLLWSLERAGVPAIMINGRLSERSLRRYRWIAPLIGRIVGTIDALAVQAEADRARFIQLGAEPSRVTVCGNLKADGAGFADAAGPEIDRHRRLLGLGDHLLIVAGSTHHVEETVIGRVFLALSASIPALRLCLAPRHLDRCAALETELRSLGLTPQRRSRLAPGGRSWNDAREVVLLDTIGELSDYYRLAAVTIMGGTLAPIGGHNLLEPAAAGSPVLFGPHLGQWRSMADGLAAAGGAVGLPSEAELEGVLRALLADAPRRARMGAAARDYVRGQQGATERTIAVIEPWMGPVPPLSSVIRSGVRPALAAWLYGAGDATFFMPLLRPLAWGYGRLMALRRLAYRRGWAASTRLPVRVVSIGNLTVGGSGKTPMVIALAEWLRAAGWPVGIVLRGYRGRRARDPLLVSDGRSVIATVDEAGDEAVLLARRLPGVPVAVGRRRAEAGRLLVEQCAPRLLLIDDGFQHLALRRDVNLLLVDIGQPLDGAAPLPAGPLREEWSAVRDASAVLLVDRLGTGRAEEAAPAWLPRLRRRGFSGPLFSVRLRASGVIACASGALQPIDALAGARVAICSGVAQPSAFREMVTRAGASILAEWIFGDHHGYARDEALAIAREAGRRGAAMVVTTEKDAVKLTDWPADGPPLVALRLSVSVEPERDWRDWLAVQRLAPADAVGGHEAAATGAAERSGELLCSAPQPGHD